MFHTTILREVATPPVRLGVIVNPRARYLQSYQGIQAMMKVVGPDRVIATQSLSELPEALSFLFHQQQITVLGICGGDGTLHHTINAYLRLHQDKLRPTGSSGSSGLAGTPGLSGKQGISPQWGSFVGLPPLLLLRGGTLNIVARAMKVIGHTTHLLQGFLRRFERASLADLPLRPLHILGVTGAEEQTRYGFIFGSQITARCLELYEQRFGAGYAGLIKLLQAVVHAYMWKDELWQQFQPMLSQPEGVLSLDEFQTAYQAVVASTVDIKLLGGWITGMRFDPREFGTFAVRMLLPQTPGTLVRNLPNLIFGREGQGIIDRQDVQILQLEQPIDYSLDGEVFSPERRGPFVVSSPVWTLPVIAPFP